MALPEVNETTELLGGRAVSTTPLWRKTKLLVQRNAGLLLVAASQIFFALMNVTVKALNSMDPPVSALEVRA